MSGPTSRTLVTSCAASALGAMASATNTPLAGGVAALCFGIAASSCLTLLVPRRSAVLHRGLSGGALPSAPRGFELAAALLWTTIASWALYFEGTVDVALPLAAWATLGLVMAKAGVLAARHSFAGDPGDYRASVGVAALAALASLLVGLPESASTVAAAGIGLAGALVSVSVLATPRSAQSRQGRHGRAASAAGNLFVSSGIVFGAAGIGFVLNPDPAQVALSAAAGALTLALGGIVAAGGLLVTRASVRPSACVETLWEASQIAESKGGRDDETLEAVLAHLGQLSLRERARPQLWLIDDNQTIRSDLAGDAQRSTDACPPLDVLRLASAEPLGVLRREVAERYAHSPTVKIAAEWLGDRAAACAARLGTTEDPIGLLLLPVGNSTLSLGAPELTAVRELCDRLSAPLLARASLARARDREQQVRLELTDARARIDALEQRIHASGDQQRRFAELLARPLDAASYSPHFRLARERLDRFARSMPAVAIVMPFGSDPIPWAARFHASSPRADQPLVCTDAGTLAVELAAGATLPGAGTLAVFDVTALTLPLQQRLATWLSERRLDSGLPDGVGPGLVVSSFATPAELRERGLLDKRLAEWLDECAVVAPTLAERPEDLRALTLDVLCLVGLRTRGEPLGMAPAALNSLVDHLFRHGLEANEAELLALIYRAAAHAQTARSGYSGVLRLQDLEAAGVRPQPSARDAEAHPAEGAPRDKLAPC